jgi:hypothetical protein
MIKTVRHIMNKMDKNIKVVFQTNLEENVISWENHVNEIIDGIESGKRLTFKVYMKNLMPIKEMDNSVRELCDTINTRFDTFSKYYRNNECIAAGYTEMLASATYYIEISPKE